MGGGKPGITRPAPGEREQQRDGRGRHQTRAEQVELVLVFVARQAFEAPGRHKGRDQSEWNVEPEDDRPVEVLGQDAADDRTAEPGGHPDASHVGLVAAALARRDRVGEDGLRQGKDAAAADPLQAASQDQQDHVGRRGTGDGAGREDADRRQHHGAAPVNVAELSIQRGDHGRAQQVGRDHPWQQLEIAKIAADGRQGGGDDGLIERGEEHRQHETEHDGADLAMAEHPASGLRARQRLGHLWFRHPRFVFRFCVRRLPRCSIRPPERVDCR